MGRPARRDVAEEQPFPGVAPEDWQPEPSPLAEMNPGSGEIIWSTIFPPEIANEILDLDVDD